MEQGGTLLQWLVMGGGGTVLGVLLTRLVELPKIRAEARSKSADAEATHVASQVDLVDNVLRVNDNTVKRLEAAQNRCDALQRDLDTLRGELAACRNALEGERADKLRILRGSEEKDAEIVELRRQVDLLSGGHVERGDQPGIGGSGSGGGGDP